MARCAILQVGFEGRRGITLAFVLSAPPLLPNLREGPRPLILKPQA
jgi:hypothetical protein